MSSPTKGLEVGRGIVSGPPVAILVSGLSGVCATTSGDSGAREQRGSLEERERKRGH